VLVNVNSYKPSRFVLIWWYTFPYKPVCLLINVIGSNLVDCFILFSFHVIEIGFIHGIFDICESGITKSASIVVQVDE
jgi:hypothetical protein